MTCLLIFLNRSMMTSRTTMFKNNRAKLAKLFMLVILIGLFFRQWFTHFCDIYVFLLQFRRKKMFFSLNPQFPFKVEVKLVLCVQFLLHSEVIHSFTAIITTQGLPYQHKLLHNGSYVLNFYKNLFSCLYLK